MDKLGDYEYPTLRTFKDSLDMARITLEKHGGIISIADAAKQLGYSVSNPNAISGTVYKHINDICMYGLLTREVRAGLKATPLAKDALDPLEGHTALASMAKAKALLQIPLIDRAYSAWGGVMPEETAIPARLNELTGADWTECKKKSANIKNLLTEAFYYIRLSNQGGIETTPLNPLPMDRGEGMKTETQSTPPLQSGTQQPKTPTSMEEYVLGDGIRIYLPKENLKASWEKAKRAMKVLIEEENN